MNSPSSSSDLSDEDLLQIEQALSVLEAQFGKLRALQEQRFITESRESAANSPAFPDVGTDVVRVAAMLDSLRPRMLRLRRLAEDARETETASGIGNRVADRALEGYVLLKMAAQSGGRDAQPAAPAPAPAPRPRPRLVE